MEAPTETLLSPWADQIHECVTVDRLHLTRVQESLSERGCDESYTSVRRFVRKRGWSRRRTVTVRMGEVEPGEVAEMDFGRMGMADDPETGGHHVVRALIKMQGLGFGDAMSYLHLRAKLHTTRRASKPNSPDI